MSGQQGVDRSRLWRHVAPKGLCDKWFETVRTPAKQPRRLAQKKKIASPDEADKDGTAITCDLRAEEDDVFNSTPMRMTALFQEERESRSIFGMGAMSPIPAEVPTKRKEEAEYDQDLTRDQLKIAGQKTYIQELRRGVARAEKTRKKARAKKAKIGKGMPRAIKAKEYEGQVAIDGSMSPGGTLRVKTTGHSDEEDDFFESDEEDVLC